jgi:putative hydrolase of the HAD superfamily
VIRTVILDLGNVLVWHDNDRLFERLAQRARRQPSEVAKMMTGPNWLAANLGQLDSEGIRRTSCAALGVDIPPAEFFPLFCSHFRVHEEVLPLVERLVGRVKLVLLSNTNAIHADYCRKILPLLRRFDHVLLSHELGRVKPDPELFREALRRAETRPDETAFFDDLPEYVEAARALGIQAFRFTDAASFAGQLASIGLA